MKFKNLFAFILSITVLSTVNGQELQFYTRLMEPMIDLKMMSIDQEEIQISELEGKVVLLSLMGTYCGPCKKMLNELEAQLLKDDHEQFVLLLVGVLDEEHHMREFKESKGYDAIYIADPKQEIREQLTARGVPRNILIDKDGTVVFQAMAYNKTPFENLIKKIKSLI